MADAKSTQNPSPCHSLEALTARPTEPVLYFDRAASRLELADTAIHRLSAGLSLLKFTATHPVTEVDDEALAAVSEAAYLLVSDGYDLFQALI